MTELTRRAYHPDAGQITFDEPVAVGDKVTIITTTREGVIGQVCEVARSGSGSFVLRPVRVGP